MKYLASVTMKNDNTGKKEISIVEGEYRAKKDFYNDLRGNGYSVRFITTEDKFDEDCYKYHERCEENKRTQKTIYSADKRTANRMNMSVTEYRKYLKSIWA